MQDFIGQGIYPGSWVATGGKGNTAAEYGMILYRVLAISPKLKLQRLRVVYTKQVATASVSTVTATNTNKYVVVDPPTPVKELFNRVVDGTATQKDHTNVGQWTHGIPVIHWT